MTGFVQTSLKDTALTPCTSAVSALGVFRDLDNGDKGYIHFWVILNARF